MRRRWPRVQRTLSLKDKEIQALQQLVARIEAVEPARQEFSARVTMLTRFIRQLLGAGDARMVSDKRIQ